MHTGRIIHQLHALPELQCAPGLELYYSCLVQLSKYHNLSPDKLTRD